MKLHHPQRLLPVLCIAVLAGCGGGSDAEHATPQEAVAALRMRALEVATQTVTPEEAARQLMDFGEAQYPQFFPSRQPTQSFPPFAYRHYAQTGVYLGVVVTAGQGYEYMGVYVMGGPFGDAPAYVGPLASFITPSVLPGPSGASNGCYDMMLAGSDVAGTRLVTVQRYETSSGRGLHGVTHTTDMLVRGARAFEGHDAVEGLQRMAAAAFAEGIPAGTPDVTEWLVYSRKTGAAEVTFYGSAGETSSTTTVGGITITSTASSRSVAMPPLVRHDYSIPLGGGATMATTYHNRMVTTTTVTGQAPTTQESSTQAPASETVRFVRREPVTVPAGSFNACVFERSMDGTVSTVWVADGKGFDLKMVSTSAGGEVTTMQTHSIRWNGQAVTN